VFDFILNPLKIIVSWILVQFHSVFSGVFGSSSGVTWSLSIVGLVLVIRIVLIPLFVKQIRSQRNLQLIQPQMKEIQTKYAGDRERQAQEMQKLYRETGTNPLASCFPLLAQTPVFFALFSVLQGISMEHAQGVFQWSQYTPLLAQAHNASIFGVPLYGTFMNAAETAAPQATRILAAIMVVLMTATTFTTQRQLIVKNVAADNPIVQQQKVLLYVFPFVFAIGGVGFPIGVLLYWLTTNLWSMGQQFWVIRNSPSVGTPAHAAYLERKAAKAKKRGFASEEVVETETESKSQRVQPKRQARSKRKK
jgi:YidC/Oxa1 family membrane protein insertase